MKSRWFVGIVLGLGLFAVAASAADYPQWRGPNRDGISKETGLLKQWPKEGPKLLWQLKNIGDGYSTPSVVGDRLYLMSNRGMDDEFVLALESKDGKQAWSTSIGKVGPNQMMQYPAARSTPTVDGELLFALGSDGDLVCLETASGKLRWKKSLRADFGGEPGYWAYSESPLVDGDVLVCTPGGSKATMLALNKKTGDVIWKTPIPEPGMEKFEKAAYASIIPVTVAGVKQYVQSLSMDVVGVDAKTGKLLWRYDKTTKGSPAVIPTPVAHDGYVYTAGARVGAGLLKLKAQGGEFTAEPVYFDRALPQAIGGSVLIKDYLYGTTMELMCVEFKTGKIKWKNESVGTASLCSADGLLYLHGENGEVALVEASPDGYKEKGRFTPPDQPKHTRGAMEKAWAYPVVANGKLYIRLAGSLWCYDVKGS